VEAAMLQAIKKDYNQQHSCTCCCWHTYCRCYQLTGPQKCS